MTRRWACVVVAAASLLALLPPARPAAQGPRALQRVARSSFSPLEDAGKTFILVVGSDAREGNPNGVRADALHLVGVNPKAGRAGVLNFPRDSWVSIPGSGQGRINEALNLGGPELLERTIEDITGIAIDGWVLTGFEGFRGIVGHLGGVKIRVQRDLYDPGGSGANLDAGRQVLDAEESLAYVRTRHNFPQGDIDRTTNQGRFLIALLRKLRTEAFESPASVLRWMTIAGKRTRTSLSPSRIFRLGIFATGLRARDVGNETVPVTVGNVGAASVVFITPGAQSVYDRFERNGYL